LFKNYRKWRRLQDTLPHLSPECKQTWKAVKESIASLLRNAAALVLEACEPPPCTTCSFRHLLPPPTLSQPRAVSRRRGGWGLAPCSPRALPCSTPTPLH
jgi:hypothetical protein